MPPCRPDFKLRFVFEVPSPATRYSCSVTLGRFGVLIALLICPVGRIRVGILVLPLLLALHHTIGLALRWHLARDY